MQHRKNTYMIFFPLLACLSYLYEQSGQRVLIYSNNLMQDFLQIDDFFKLQMSYMTFIEEGQRFAHVRLALNYLPKCWPFDKEECATKANTWLISNMPQIKCEVHIL